MGKDIGLLNVCVEEDPTRLDVEDRFEGFDDSVEDRLHGSTLFKSKNGAEADVRAVKYEEIDRDSFEDDSVLLMDEVDS